MGDQATINLNFPPFGVAAILPPTFLQLQQHNQELPHEQQTAVTNHSSNDIKSQHKTKSPKTHLSESSLDIKKEIIEDADDPDISKEGSDPKPSVSKSDKVRTNSFEQFWKVVRHKVVSNLSLWDFLIEKTRYSCNTLANDDKPTVDIIKMELMLSEVELLLVEVSELLRLCCESSTMETSRDVICLSRKLSKVFKSELKLGKNSEQTFIRLKNSSDIPAKFKTKLFSQIQSEEIEEANDDATTLNECTASRILKIKLEENQSNEVEANIDEYYDSQDNQELYPEQEYQDVDESNLEEETPIKKVFKRKKRKLQSPASVKPPVAAKKRKTFILNNDDDDDDDDDDDADENELPDDEWDEDGDIEQDDIDPTKPKGSASAKPFSCLACKKHFDKRKSYAYHLKKGRCPGKPEPKKLHKVIKNRYYCTHADCLSASGNVRDNSENFSTRNNYFKHYMENHCKDSDLTFGCDICSAKFPFQELYKLHIKTKHDKQFTCRFCGQSFAEKRTLEKHERRHTGEKPYKCDRCDFRCNSSSSLCLHKRRKHDPGEKGRVHVCELCGKGFFTRDNLKDHIATHSDIKLFSCYICGKGLKNDSCYRRHMVCVHGQKFTCEICNRDFSSKFGLDNHKREQHGILY